MKSDNSQSGTISRTISVLRALAEVKGDIQLKTLADDLQLPPSTVHRLLDLLSQENMVERDGSSRRYRVGREFLRLSALVFNSHPLRSLAIPLLREAVEECNETAYLGLYLPQQRRMMFVAQIESSHSLGYRVRENEALSVLTGASGLSISAHLSQDVIDLIYEEGRQESDVRKAISSRKALNEELIRIREQGYAITYGKRIPGAVGIFSGFFDGSGSVMGCIGFTIPEQRYSKSLLPKLAGTVSDVARKISESMGYDLIPSSTNNKLSRPVKN